MDNNDKINLFAKCSFRNMADKEYIIARMAFRARFALQFYWSAVRSIEQYIMCIRIFNRIHIAKEVRNSNYFLRSLLNEVEDDLLYFPNEVKEFITYLDDVKSNSNSVESQVDTSENQLFLLDLTVWNLRKYCCDFLYDYSENGMDRIEENFNIINSATHYLDFSIGFFDGYLNSVIISFMDKSESGMINHRNNYDHLVYENEFFQIAELFLNIKILES